MFIEVKVENVVIPTTTHQSKKIVKAGKFTKLADTPELNAAKDFWRLMLMKDRPAEPISMPCFLLIQLYWPYRSSEPKKNRNGLICHSSKPDCSNMAKTIEDRLVELGYIKDDALVSTLQVSKYWSEKGGFRIVIDEDAYDPFEG